MGDSFHAAERKESSLPCTFKHARRMEERAGRRALLVLDTFRLPLPLESGGSIQRKVRGCC